MTVSMRLAGPRLRSIVLATAALGLAATTLAATGDSLGKLFPFAADVTSEGGTLSRLELPPEVVGRCRADLSDIRLFDPEGGELAFAVERGRASDLLVVHRARAEVASAERWEERPEATPPRFYESYTVVLPELPPPARSWELVLESDRPELVYRVDIRTLAPDGSLAPLLEKGSAFRLRSPAAERLRFPLPVEGPARLVVQLTGEGAGHLEPGLVFEAVSRLTGRGLAELPLEVLDREQRPGQTIVTLARPRGLVPSRLRLRTSTVAFHRPVTVWDGGAGALRTPLGRGTLVRLAAIVPVEATELALAPARGDRLKVVVEDGDSPALADLGFAVEVARPTLFFALPARFGSATLCFGGARARKPRYDLAHLARRLEPGLTGEAAERALAFWDPATAVEARLGTVTPNPVYDPAPALAFAWHPGAQLSPKPYSHRRQLSVTPSEEGLSRLRLGPEDVAIVRADLGDLRVVDGEARQWAYLLEHGSEREPLPLRLLSTRHRDQTTTYELAPPAGPVEARGITLSSLVPFFDRAFELRGERPDEAVVTLASGRLVRRQGDLGELSIGFPGDRLRRFELVVHDGDDAPLALTDFTAEALLSDLYLAAPPGSYTLLLGNPEAEPPRYELERVRSTVLAVPSTTVAAGVLERNPAFRPSSRLVSASAREHLLVWVTLAIAVVALGALTLRLARQERSE